MRDALANGSTAADWRALLSACKGLEVERAWQRLSERLWVWPFVPDQLCETPEPQTEGDERKPNAGRMTWQEAAKRLECLRSQGEPFTSQHKLAGVFGCSSGTINKAIRSSPQLEKWAKPPEAAPRAQQGITTFV